MSESRIPPLNAAPDESRRVARSNRENARFNRYLRKIPGFGSGKWYFALFATGVYGFGLLGLSVGITGWNLGTAALYGGWILVAAIVGAVIARLHLGERIGGGRQLSDDGQWWWDGSQWHLVSTAAASVVAPAQVVATPHLQRKSRKDKLREAALTNLVNGELLSAVDAIRIKKELELARLADSAEWAGMNPDQRRAWLSAKAADILVSPHVQLPKDRLKQHYSSDGLQRHLIEELPRGLTKALADQLGSAEIVRIALRGLNREALVCTDARVIILKTGFVTGQLFGGSTYQLPYANIAGAEVRAHLVTAYLQLNAGGMNSTDLSVWNMRWGPNGTPPRRTDPARAPNAIALARYHVPRFQEASAFIMSEVAKAHRLVIPPSETARPTTNPRSDALDSLEQLGRLKDAGVLTQEEFDLKKAELLGRL